MTYAIIWSYEAAPDRVAAFEAAYAPDGAWVRLFQEAPGFIGTELYRATDQPDRFLTIDRWTSRAAYDAFRQTHAARYGELDAECEALTAVELFVGSVETG
jgi:quinol monooxygenase YgiN